MGQVVSGTFRNKIATAAIFGVIETARGEVSLTDLGEQIVDPQREDAARVAAFLSVPLYAQVVETFKGRRLPAESGLEAEMVKMGVSPKQVGKARQAMNRSAEFAGFFSLGRDRLIAPTAATLPGVTPPPPPADLGPIPENLSGLANDPLIVGLWKRLPPAQVGAFTSEQQAEWLEAATVILRMLYGSGGTRPSHPKPEPTDASIS